MLYSYFIKKRTESELLEKNGSTDVEDIVAQSDHNNSKIIKEKYANQAKSE